MNGTSAPWEIDCHSGVFVFEAAHYLAQMKWRFECILIAIVIESKALISFFRELARRKKKEDKAFHTDTTIKIWGFKNSNIIILPVFLTQYFLWQEYIIESQIGLGWKVP